MATQVRMVLCNICRLVNMPFDTSAASRAAGPAPDQPLTQHSLCCDLFVLQGADIRRLKTDDMVASSHKARLQL